MDDLRDSEMFPREGEDYFDWLARVDAPTARFFEQERPVAEIEAARRGRIEGGWLALSTLFNLLGNGETDAASLVESFAAVMAGLKRNRMPEDFRLALERHLAESDERREQTRDDGDAP